MMGYFSCPAFAILIVPFTVVKASLKRPVNPGYRTTPLVLVDIDKVLSGASMHRNSSAPAFLLTSILFPLACKAGFLKEAMLLLYDLLYL